MFDFGVKTMENADRHIRGAWIGGLAFAGLIIFFTPHSGPVSWLCYVSVFPIIFGVYKKSRICAILLFLMALGWTAFGFDGRPLMIAIAACLALNTLRGIIGTIGYHRLKNAGNG